MILTRRRRGIACAASAGVAIWSLAGCGDSGDSAATADGPAILATTTIWADIATQVACGESIGAIVPAGADPHSFEPSLRDRASIDGADVVIANGNDLEHSLVDLLHTAADNGVDVVEITPHVTLLGSDHAAHADEQHDDEHTDDEHTDDEHTDDEHTDDEHTDDEHTDDEHDHGADDPHVWQDPVRVAGALDVIAEALVSTGRDAAEIDACRDAYARQLADLDTEIAEILAPIPPERRLLVTSHDSLAYFADRYDFEIVGTVIPAANTLAETSAAQLADLADQIRALHVPAIFTEQLESTADADALAERLGVRIVPLVTDALVDDPYGDTYVEMLRGNATKIAEALTT